MLIKTDSVGVDTKGRATMEYFKCIVCGMCRGEDHRWCLVALFKDNKIQSVKEWEVASSKPPTIRKGRIRAGVPKE